MLAERPIMTGYACVRQGSYQRELYEVKRVMGKLQQLPTDSFQVYHGVSVEQYQGWQPIIRCHMGAFSYEPICFNINSTSGGTAYNGCRESKSVVGRNYSKAKQEVSAFGPKHAEHARRFYQSKGTHPESQRNLAPPYRPNYCPMQVSYIKQAQANIKRDLLGESVFERTINSTRLYNEPVSRQVPVAVASQYEAVLKVAKISPRPNKKQPENPESGVGVSERVLRYQMDEGKLKKPIDSQNVEDDIDLSKAPVFQILCEISKY